jgi:hypothetical protein
MSAIPLYSNTQMNVPRGLSKGSRPYGNNEFLFFKWNPILDKSKFKVFVENLNGEWLSLGNLNDMIYIPAVHFPHNAILVVVGRNNSGKQIRFTSNMARGRLYVMNSIEEGDYKMQVFSGQNL